MLGQWKTVPAHQLPNWGTEMLSRSCSSAPDTNLFFQLFRFVERLRGLSAAVTRGRIVLSRLHPEVYLSFRHQHKQAPSSLSVEDFRILNDSRVSGSPRARQPR